jgi:hypothetical protein
LSRPPGHAADAAIEACAFFAERLTLGIRTGSKSAILAPSSSAHARVNAIALGLPSARTAICRQLDNGDPNFLYIVATTGIRDDIVDELLVRRAAGRAQNDAKVVKIGVDWEDRTLTFAAEQLVTTPGGEAIFWRTVALLDYTISSFYNMLDEEVGRVAASHFTAQLEADLATKDTL